MKKLRQDGGYGVNTKAKLYTSTTETENKRFLNNGSMIFDNRTPLTTTETVDLLNEFNDENQRITSLLQSERRELIEQNNNYRKLLNELAEEKEDWKNNCLQSVNENSILWNEIFILMEQDAEPSNAFKNYLNGLKNKNKKLEGDLE